MRLLKKSVIVGAAAAALTLGVTTTQAQASPGYAAQSGNSCGYAQFEDLDELFYIHDTCSDGRGVRLYWDLYDDGKWAYYDYRGGYTGWSNHHTLNLNYDEKLPIRFKVCLSDNGVLVNGSCGTSVLDYT